MGERVPLWSDRLAIRAERGKVELEGSRVLIVSASALGTLRRDLIAALGPERAKGFLLRYGFECGYRDAIAVRQRYAHRGHRFWTEQAALLHTLEGVARVRIEERRIDRARGHYEVKGVWENSYEAQEHLRLLGASPDASCWTLIGYAGGYLSAVMGERVLYKELTCVARGDAECRFVGKTVNLWGPEAEAELAYYTESKIVEELDEAHRRIRDQHRILAQITFMHDQLTKIVLEGRGRQALVETVGRMLNAAVAVEDPQLRPLASWIPPEQQGSPPFLGPVAERDRDLVEKLRVWTADKRAVELGPDDHPLLEPRCVAPIVAGGERMGYIAMAVPPEQDRELVRMFIERAAAAMGLELLKERIALETESRLKGELIEDLLEGRTDPDALRDRVRYMGADWDRPHRFLLVRIDRPPYEALPSDVWMGRREALYNLVRAEMRRRSRDVHVVNRHSELLVLYPSGAGGEPTDDVIRLVREQARKAWRGGSLSIAVSRESRSLTELRPVFQECQAILDMHQGLGRRGQVIHVDRIGAFDLLYAGAREGVLRAYAHRKLQPLIDYDRRHGSQLLVTLYWYLAFEGNMRKTAAATNVTISGLKYRLQRLQDIAPFDLTDPETRFDLQLALRVVMLGEGAGGGGNGSHGGRGPLPAEGSGDL